MRRLVERMGYAVSVAADATETMDLIEQNDFSLILLDLIMPDTDGMELCQQIKARYPDVPVYAFSGHLKLYDDGKLERSGFDGYIPKPISMKEIQRTISDIFIEQKR